MTAFLHPGVYVQEGSSGARAIAGSSTSTAIFIGETERGPEAPVKITSILQYERTFGGYLRPDSGPAEEARLTMRYAIDAFFRNGGGVAQVVRVCSGAQVATATRTYTDGADAPVESIPLAASSPGVWGDDLRVLFAAASDGATDRFRLLVWAYDRVSRRHVFVEDWDRLSLTPGDERYVASVLARSPYITWLDDARFSLTDLVDETLLDDQPRYSGPPDSWEIGDEGGLTGGLGGDASASGSGWLNAALVDRLDGIDDAAILVGAPDMWMSGAGPDGSALRLYYSSLAAYIESRSARDLFLVADLPAEATASSVAAAVANTRTYVEGIAKGSMVAAYWPHMIVPDPIGVGPQPTISLPPSSAVAGVYARTDARRGVWKAPAGTEATLVGAMGLDWTLLDRHQDDLNPRGINVLRTIPSAGPVVWGARTLAPNTQWRYVSVRRMAMFLRKNIYEGIQWAVFEPNGEELWIRLHRAVDDFMEAQFERGAFAGSTAKEAYLVKVDSDTTTEADRAAGVVNIIVGFAPTRPAEFVIVELSQRTASDA